MCRIWSFVKEMVPGDRIRINIFLLLNTAIWFAIIFMIVLAFGLLFEQIGVKALGNALLAAGYAGVFLGFFGGCIYLMRNT